MPMKASTSGKKLRKIIAEALRQATGNDQPLRRIRLRPQLGGIQDGVDAFLLGRVNKRTTIDNDNIRFAGFIRGFHAALQERPGHNFRIDQVFSAAERNQPHPHRSFFRN